MTLTPKFLGGVAMKIFRQGDVLLRQIKELPKGLKPKQDKVLAYGEATGHMHLFFNPYTELYVDMEGKQYVYLVEDSLLEHEEHASVMIPQGTYEVVIQREFDLLEGTRQVAD
jgi:hypothetical protein